MHEEQALHAKAMAQKNLNHIASMKRKMDSIISLCNENNLAIVPEKRIVEYFEEMNRVFNKQILAVEKDMLPTFLALGQEEPFKTSPVLDGFTNTPIPTEDENKFFDN